MVGWVGELGVFCCASGAFFARQKDPALMGVTYFKRYRMEIDLRNDLFEAPPLPHGYVLIPWTDSDRVLEAHGEAKYESFRFEIDASVFPCLGDRQGCHRLMREISHRKGFLPGATWLLEYQSPQGQRESCGTIQGVRDSYDFGAVQNLGVTPTHRGLGLGRYLLHRAMAGFVDAGLQRSYLEVTAQNIGAVRLYQRVGFRIVRTVYKASDVAYA